MGLEHQGLEIQSGVTDLTPVGIMSLLVLLLDTPSLGKVYRLLFQGTSEPMGRSGQGTLISCSAS